MNLPSNDDIQLSNPPIHNDTQSSNPIHSDTQFDIRLSNFIYKTSELLNHSNNNNVIVISDDEENDSEYNSNRQEKGKQVKRDIIDDMNSNLSLAYNNTIDLDDEDFTPSEDNNIAKDLSPIPSSSLFENYSRAKAI
ncbi:23660_t:CDS:2 [Dentiscutata erythropus]|uniref:23660_t:CDS:1 n=1 Tax=Dentiscutata erythropus TaxID=1348616 RepID=A0A9N9CKF8_9GLOM|nr:23660_t:CDS:2 [Dentiscutata erythropus]